MPNTKPVGVAYSDPELVAGTTITGAAITGAAIVGGTVTGSTIDSTSLLASGVVTGAVAPAVSATVATTGNTDAYVIAPFAGTMSAAMFSGVDALTANDSNYITFTIVNLGQAGSGSTAMLAATDANTTKATGGAGIAANTRRNLTVNGTAANLVVARGDRLRIRAAATGTLANTVTFPNYALVFAPA